MRRRLLMAVSMSMLLVAALMPSAINAASPSRFHKIDTDKYQINSELIRKLRDLRAGGDNKRLMVFVQLAQP